MGASVGYRLAGAVHGNSKTDLRCARPPVLWDTGRLLSKAMGETGRKSIVWDQVIVYGRGVIWSEASPPKAMVRLGPVVDVVEQFVEGLHQALGSNAVGAAR